MPVHFYDPHYGRWPCTQAFDCSLPALATAHDAVSQKSADFSHPSSVSSSLTWGTLCCLLSRDIVSTVSRDFSFSCAPRWVTRRVLRVFQRYIPVGFSGQQIAPDASGLLQGWVDAVWASLGPALRPQESADRSLCLSTSAPLPLEAVAGEERNDVTEPDITWGTLFLEAPSGAVPFSYPYITPAP